jgi:hypothetical protein
MHTKTTYHEAGNGCVEYLLAHLHPNGAFDYLFDPQEGPVGNEYNLLRHGGTLYALFQWFNLHKIEPPKKQLEAGVSYLASFIRPLGDARHMTAVVFENEAKLGGAALALLMYTERYKWRKSAADLRIMRSLAECIIWMQEPSGRFLSKYMYREKVFSDFVSVYYPGEAMLALLRLYEIDPDPRWLQSVVSGSEFLLLHPVMDGQVRGHNHWFATALSELYLVQPENAFYDEFWKIADATIDAIPSRIVKGSSSASMATVGETAMAALILELKMQKTDRLDAIKAAIQTVLSYCLGLQVKDQDSKAVGGIMENTGKPKIRIDYVQHTLQVISGWLRCFPLSD